MINLNKSSARGWLIFPPLFICITGLGVVFAHMFSNFSFTILHWVSVLYIVSSIWLIVSVLILVFFDANNDSRRYAKNWGLKI